MKVFQEVRYMNSLTHWDMNDWRDPDKRLLNEEYVVIASIFTVIAFAAFIIGAML